MAYEPDELFDEYCRLLSAVGEFSTEMNLKLMAKAREGRRGWSDKSDEVLRGGLVLSLLDHVKKGEERGWGKRDLVDVANYCMMIHRLTDLPEEHAD